jgi:hypothetical protein
MTTDLDEASKYASRALDHSASWYIAEMIQEIRQLRGVLNNLVRHVDSNTCRHEQTHRGGAIWTICDDCGMKWADDRGGFKSYRDAPELKSARALIEASRRQTTSSSVKS